MGASDLIRDRGWVQGQLLDHTACKYDSKKKKYLHVGDEPLDMYGAICEASKDDMVAGGELVELLEAELGVHPVGWNDAPDRTQLQVTDKLISLADWVCKERPH